MKPVLLGITVGDVGGIGPEVALKATDALRRRIPARLVLIGSAAAVRREARRLRLPVPPQIPSPDAARAGIVTLWDPLGVNVPVKRGLPTAAAARAAAGWIEAAAAACEDGRLSGMVTAPISKEGLWKAGIREPGHTELLARLTRTRRYAMMLIGGGLRVVLVTRHIPLAAVSRRLTAAAIVEAAEIACGGLSWLGAANPRLGVCGLNPHAGDGGLLGREEQRIIRPAVRSLQRRGVPVEGPVPADVIFHMARKGRYGAMIAMYHDQGLGPLKMLGFDKGVNLTLGLPILRTSPDHGTAFDIAGQGVANPASMIEAIRLARRLARRRNPWRRGAA
jgi:4-hydroxythreonine-4-phosphate dehydrogenase